MLGLGWTEMLVVGVVALIVIGPKDLPVVMQRIGKFAGQIRRMGSDFQRELNKTTGLDEVRNLRQSITDPLRKSTEEIRREFNAMTPTGPKPSGLIKPADPSKESVADEIRAAAGMPPKAEAPKAEAPKAEAPKTEAPKAPVKAARTAPAKPPAKAAPVAKSAVERKELAPVEAKPAPVKAPRTRKAAATKPAAAAGKPATRKAPAKKAEKPVAARKTETAEAAPLEAATKKPTARKSATRKKPAAKPAPIGGEG